MHGDQEPWEVQVLVFSGRPDPTWEISAEDAERVLALWRRAPAVGGPAQEAPALGYRGCVLHAPDGRAWTAFGGTVTGPDGDLRHDRDETIERLLRSGAPPGALPPHAAP